MASRSGPSFTDVDANMLEHFMSVIYASLPNPAVSTAAYLTTGRAAPSDGVDRISGLSDALLRDIVSRLPAKDAARTAVLATRWRGVWRSAPLVLIDAHLSGGAWPPTDTPAVAAAVSRVLAAHPGPFRCVHLVYSRMSERQAELRRWLRLLAARGVQELVLVNRPWPINVPLPKTLFTISTLTRLYIGVWKFPDATALRGVSFPHLRELGLCLVFAENGDIDAVVTRSPVLEILNIHTSIGLRLRLVSNSLRCVQVCASTMESIAVVNAPCLERLILSDSMNSDGLCTRVKIGNAPKLRLFGYLEPRKYALEIRDTVIKAGMEATPTMMLTTVKILSFDVCFGVHKDIEMMPTFLRCFPNVEVLHIQSAECDHPTGNLNLRFWEDQAGPIISVLFRIKVMTFNEFRGEQYELSFLQCFFESARVLKYAVIKMANSRFTSLSVDEMLCSVQNMSDEKWASKFDLAVCGSKGPEGGRLWNFQRGADFSAEDPLAPVKIQPKRSKNKGKLQGRPLEPNVNAVPDAAGGVPPPLLPSMAWFRNSPSADGKSPVAGSGEPTPRPAIFIARRITTLTFFFLFTKLRPDRQAGTGEGLTTSTDPWICELGEGGSSTADLRRALLRERTSSSAKRHAASTAVSTAPSASDLEDPTLCTGRGSTIPNPPAAEAAAGEEGIAGPTASEVDLPVRFTKSSLSTVAGKGNGQASSCFPVLTSHIL